MVFIMIKIWKSGQISYVYIMLSKARNNMNDYINKLLIAQSVVEELKNKNRASYSNAFVTVINAINAEIVESLKESSLNNERTNNSIWY